jgi:hypothetical protein
VFQSFAAPPGLTTGREIRLTPSAPLGGTAWRVPLLLGLADLGVPGAEECYGGDPLRRLSTGAFEFVAVRCELTAACEPDAGRISYPGTLALLAAGLGALAATGWPCRARRERHSRRGP